ncbi:MAG: aminotransferase class III-fold pyridoxal phosphate-dependent enzyme [Acidimicrobiales bacterium]
MAEKTIEEYEAKTPASRAYFEKFCRHLPGGETRSVTHYDPYPVVLADGHGALVRDVDGNEYIDVLNNYTSLVHGHGFGPITEAVRAMLPTGTVFPAPTTALLDLASTLTGRYPAAKRVRFANSGTEASLLATRITRAATGRRRLVVFGGGYHGSIPEFLDSGGDILTVPYNDFERTLDAIDSSVAAVFVEPFLGSGGVIPAAPGFMQAIENRAHAVGCLFVLDEVQSLRNAFHGTHSELSLEPDLLLMGKVIGGGFPVGALGGGAPLMDLTSANAGGPLSHSGSFNGNVVTMRAGVASLRALDEEAISLLNRRAGWLSKEIVLAARRVGIPASVTRAGSILQVHMIEQPPGTHEATRAVPATWVAQLHLALLLEGVYAAPRGMLNLSTALDDDRLAAVARAYENAFARVLPVVKAEQSVGAASR